MNWSVRYIAIAIVVVIVVVGHNHWGSQGSRKCGNSIISTGQLDDEKIWII